MFGTSSRAPSEFIQSLLNKRRQRADRDARKRAYQLVLPAGALLFQRCLSSFVSPAFSTFSTCSGVVSLSIQGDPMVKRSLTVLSATLVLVSSAGPFVLAMRSDARRNCDGSMSIQGRRTASQKRQYFSAKS